MSLTGRRRRLDKPPITSGLARLTDIPSARRHVSKLPNPEMSAHSTSSSARASSDAGTVTPWAFAVLRLIASSNFVGC